MSEGTHKFSRNTTVRWKFSSTAYRIACNKVSKWLIWVQCFAQAVLNGSRRRAGLNSVHSGPTPLGARMEGVSTPVRLCYYLRFWIFFVRFSPTRIIRFLVPIRGLRAIHTLILLLILKTPCFLPLSRKNKYVAI